MRTDGPVVLEFPFRGLPMARNSPARRGPSHGTEAFGVTDAIDFVAVGEGGLPAARSWRTFLATDSDRFEPARGVPMVFRGSAPGSRCWLSAESEIVTA